MLFRSWAGPLALAAIGAFAFQFLTLVQPPVSLGVVVVLALAVALASTWRTPVAALRPRAAGRAR